MLEYFLNIKSVPFIQEVEGENTTKTSKQPSQLYRFVEAEINSSIYHVKA